MSDIIPTIIGTEDSETLDGSKSADVIVGLAGDDTISGAGGDDMIFGDYVDENLLQGAIDATSFAQYGETGFWDVVTDGEGQTSMSQSVETVAGAEYSIEFQLAANYGAGTVSGAVEVLWNGEVVSSFDTNSGVFEAHKVTMVGTGGDDTLTFRSIDSDVEPAGPQIDTSGPIFTYDKVIEVEGEEVTVKAFAPGQAKIYQALNGKLHYFDPATETYAAVGADATAVVNSIGFNAEDDLIYGVAVKTGVDALGNPVSMGDLVIYDATGATYRAGETPYRSWTGDFDDHGNLWYFEADMDRVTRVDVGDRDADGNPIATTYKFPKDLITDKVWDVGFDQGTQTFYGLVRPDGAGEVAKLIEIDISQVEEGGEPIFSSHEVKGTIVDGEFTDGVPAITFGAFVVDGDGNLYAGGNGGDHDMDGGTRKSGGVYRVDQQADGSYILVLVADAPEAYSNDGAVDPRAMDPFEEVDTYAAVLIRSPELTPEPTGETSYDDRIEGNAGMDTASGGIGEDIVIGQSAGDMLEGNDGDDALYGGAGPESTSTIQSFYDEGGLRYDQFGTLLQEDDDVISGGDGDDMLSGSAGHDTLRGDAGNDDLFGGSGHDILEGGTGNDTLSGGSEDDQLDGGSGDDALDGGNGDDSLAGGDGNDTLNGGSGDDVLDGGKGDDTLSGGSGNDTLDGSYGTDVLDGGSGDDELIGGIGADELKGGSGADRLNGGEDDDLLDGGKDADTLNGGEGRDTLKGGSGDDILNGDDGKDYLNGGSGNDILDGGANDDRLYLGAGDDIADGGAGNDRFVFRFEDRDGGTDTIIGFRNDTGETDMLDLRQLDLLATYVDFETWQDAKVQTLSASNDVSIDLDGCMLVLEDTHGVGTDFLSNVCDAILI